MYRPQRGEAEATRARNASQEARRKAELAEADAKRAEAETDAINQFLVQNLLTFGRLKEWRRPTDTIGQVLDDAAQAVEASFVGQPKLEASVRLTIGMTYRNIGRLYEAERHLRRALELRDNLLAGSTDPWGREYFETALATYVLGTTLSRLPGRSRPSSSCTAARKPGAEWRFAPPSGIGSIRSLQSPVRGLVFSPDGRWLLASGDDSCFRLWDVAILWLIAINLQRMS